MNFVVFNSDFKLEEFSRALVPTKGQSIVCLCHPGRREKQFAHVYQISMVINIYNNTLLDFYHITCMFSCGLAHVLTGNWSIHYISKSGYIIRD